MKWTSMLAIYGLFWVMAGFIVLPFGVRTSDEMGTVKVEGQAESAPANFSARKLVVRTTILSAALFAFFYANYFNEWITAADLDLTTYIGH